MLRTTVLAAAGFTMLTLATAGSAAELTQGGVIPYFVDGANGEWTTTISLTCLTSPGCTFTATFVGSNGQPANLSLRITTGDTSSSASASTVQRTVAVGTTTTIETAGGGAATIFGGVDIVSNSSLAGYSTFRQRVPGRPDYEATVLMESRDSGRTFILPFDNRSGFSTGIALTNLSDDRDANVAVEAVDHTNRSFFTGRISLEELNSIAFNLQSRFPETAGRAGFLTFRSDSANITGTGFRFNPSGPFTTLPIFNIR